MPEMKIPLWIPRRRWEDNIKMCYEEVRREGCVRLNFKSLAVSLRTTRFNIQKFYTVLALR